MIMQESKTEENRPLRNHEQSMGIWMNEPMLRDPEMIERDIGTLADCGYGIVRLFLRHTNFTFRSPEVVALVGRGVKRAHERGLRAILDCEPHHLISLDLGREFPDAMGSKLVRGEAIVSDGHWIMRVDAPEATAIFADVEAAFLSADGCTRKIALDFAVRAEKNNYINGDIHREMNYAEGVPMAHRKVTTLRGKLPECTEGKLVAYLRFESLTLPDFWARSFHDYFDRLLDCYRHIPLDGVGWDEPAIDGDWESYRYGSGFAGAFERLNGYRLPDKLHLLDEEGLSGEAAKVRLDYYRTLNEGIAWAQARLNAKARELFGPNLIFGSHHTWQGEGGINDYRAGAVDYFRLNDNMDAGYTDCSWWDQPSVAYVYILGSSLGRLTPSGEAEANSWHFKPTVANTGPNVNLMSLMNINWFNIWFGSDSDCIMQKEHYTWPKTVQAMQAHRKAQRAIGTRMPVVDVAIWHGWEGVCGWNTPEIASAQKTFFLNTSHLFLQCSLAADFVDSRLLAESRVEDGRLVNRLGSYKVLIVPYGLVIPRKAFEACVAFANAGGRLVFVGTPVAFDETGESLAADFAGLLEMPEMSADHYMRGLDASCTLPKFRAQRLEVCRQLSSELPNKLESCEGEIHGVRAGEVIFLTDLDPKNRLIEHIEPVLESQVTAHGGNILWRLYRGAADDALVVVSADDTPVRGILAWEDVWIELDGGSAGVLTRDTSGKIQAEGDISWHYFQTPAPSPAALEKSCRPPRPGKRNAAQASVMAGA